MSVSSHFLRNCYKLFQRKVTQTLRHCTAQCTYSESEGHSLLSHKHKLKLFFNNIEVLYWNMANADINDPNLQSQGRRLFEEETSFGNQSGCASVSEHEQAMGSDIESFDLKKLFDMEKVVNDVKIKLKGKRKGRKLELLDCSSNGKRNNKIEKRKKSNCTDECSSHDDNDSSFDLDTLFHQQTKMTIHKGSRKSKKGTKHARKTKEDESYGLDWLFSDKNVAEKKNRRKNRKKKMINYDNSESGAEDESNKEIKHKKKRPNHFIAIRVSDTAIHLSVKTFQDALLKENEKLKPSLIPLISLHLTMAVMHLDEATIKIAQEALEKCKDKINEALKLVNFKLTFCGVGNFNNEIVFAKIKEKEQIECLKTINNVVAETFEEDGICLTDKKEYNPHLTLLKLSRKKSLRKNGIRKVEESVYDSLLDSYFGEESVTNVHLCSMQSGAKEKDGFYKCVSTITFDIDPDVDEANVTNKEENMDQN